MSTVPYGASTFASYSLRPRTRATSLAITAWKAGLSNTTETLVSGACTSMTESVTIKSGERGGGPSSVISSLKSSSTSGISPSSPAPDLVRVIFGKGDRVTFFEVFRLQSLPCQMIRKDHSGRRRSATRRRSLG